MEKPSTQMEALIEAYIELQKPIYHTPINLGINQFKKEARNSGLAKNFVNRLVKAYKKRSWMEYEGLARHRGNFPTHPSYGKSLDISGSTGESVQVKVSNG